MAAELVADLNIGNAYKETAVGYNPWARAVALGDMCGLRLHKTDANGYVWTFTIPGSLTMATGLTLTFTTCLQDVPDFAADVGKVVRLGVTFKRLADGETTDIDTAAATEQTKDITLDATAGKVDVATLAVAAANLDSAVVGDRVAVRVRRIGSHANDTAQGSIVLLGIGVANT
jgi:hypothetical protein